jgi:hypothetical protein
VAEVPPHSVCALCGKAVCKCTGPTKGRKKKKKIDKKTPPKKSGR